MEIRQLRYFLTICEYGNITRAAQEIHISQQTLSKQMKDFEAELGVPLFVRNIRGVKLTRYGQSLLKPARQIIKAVDDAQRMLEHMRDREEVTVRLGYIKGDFNSFSGLPPKRIFEWESRFPQMTLKVQEWNPDILEQMLLRGELDLAYTHGNPNPDLCKVLVATEPAYLLMSSENPLATCARLTREALADQVFLISRTEPLPEQNRLLLAEYLGYTPRFHFFNGTFDQGVEHVRANKGILFSGRAYCLSRSMDRLSAVLFPNPDAVFRHYLAYKKGAELPAPVLHFIRELRMT